MNSISKTGQVAQNKKRLSSFEKYQQRKRKLNLLLYGALALVVIILIVLMILSETGVLA